MRRKNKFSCPFYKSMLYIPKFVGNFIETDRGGSREGFIQNESGPKIIYAITCIAVTWYFADF